MSRRTRLFVRGNDGTELGEVKKFAHCSLVIRDQDVGSWSISGVPYSRLLELAEPGSSLVTERDGEELIAGPLDLDERNWSAGVDEIVVSGYDDDVHLWDTVAYPSAPIGTTGLVFSNNAYDVRTGLAEPVMKAYVTANMITGGAWVTTGRARTWLSNAPNLNRGTTVTGRARFPVLGELLVSLAVAGGDLGFGIKRGQFDVYQHRDVSDSVVFSKDLRNLYGFALKRQGPTATHMIGAGGGEAEARVFVLKGNNTLAATWGRRIEVFRDRRDTTDLVEIEQTLDEELFKGGEVFEAKLQPRDTNRASFLDGYLPGDTVTVTERKCVIRQISVTLDEKGETIEPEPSLTQANADALLEIFDSVRAIRQDVSALQRSV